MKTTVFFSVNEPGFSLSSWVGHFPAQYATGAERQAATASSKAQLTKFAAAASFTDSFPSVHFGAKGDVSLVLKLSSVLLVFFFKLLSLIAMCLKQRENIKCELTEPT